MLPGAGRRDQIDPEDQRGGQAGGPTADGGQDQAWLHEDVREVDLVDAAEELHDHRAGHGRAQPPRTEHQVGGQDAEPGAGVVSTMNRIDFPDCAVCWTPSGDSTPWLMALLRTAPW